MRGDFMIHVCFCFQDKTGRYTKFTGTAMLSLFDNTNAEVTIHILHDNTLTDDNRDKFTYLAGRYGQLVKFYNVEELCADKIAEIKETFPKAAETRFSLATFYRFFIPQVLSPDIGKAIYLDSDIIVNLDIKSLWQIELGEKILGVITHEAIGMISAVKSRPICTDGFIRFEDSFNAGVLLMNLNLLRNEAAKLSEGLNFLREHPENKFLDQDILNYCFSTRTLKLPVKFNQFVREARFKKEFPTEKIYHYIAGSLRFDFNDEFNRLWFRYFLKTPWFGEETLKNLCAVVQQTGTDLKNSTIEISALMSGKTRAFFVEPAKVESLRKIFSIRDDELIIPAKDEGSLQKLIDAMKTSQGKTLFFIMTENFLKKKFPLKRLTKARFVENKDFLKGWELVNSFNSQPLIKAM